MPKTILSAVILFFAVLTSCNNNADDQQPAVQNEEAQLKSLINKFPDSFALKDKLIGYYQQNDNYKLALIATDSFIKQDSANYKLWDIKANIYFDNDDTTNAIHAFEKTVYLYPDPQYMKPLGSLYAETANPLALVLADTLLNNPHYNSKEEALFIKGLYYSTAGDKQKAISFFDACLSINYNDMFSYREKAMCLYDMKKYQDALDVLQKAISVNSTFDEGYYWMGRCNEKLGNKDEAITNYQAALQIDKNYTEAKDALAKLQ